VSVDEERPDEAPADAQGAVQAETSSPPWGDDFDADRAWRSIQAGRETEKELKERLRAAEAAWDDEDAAYQRVSEKYKHWLEDDGSVESDDDDEYEDDDDPREAQLKELADRQAAHDQWITEQKDQAQLRAYHADVDTVQAEKEVEFDQDDRVLIAQKAASYNNDGKPFTKKELEKAVDWLIARDERVAQARLDRLKSSKRAPHVSAGGNAGKGPQPDMDTLEGRTAFYNAKMAEG
jgi:hypothetical protein